jgi:hypothetical protein
VVSVLARLINNPGGSIDAEIMKKSAIELVSQAALRSFVDG